MAIITIEGIDYKEVWVGTVGPYLIQVDDDLAEDDGQVATKVDLISAATTVVTETSFGQSSAVGTSTKVAKEDHTHGTPADPLSGGVSSATFTSADGKTVTVTNGVITNVV